MRSDPKPRRPLTWTLPLVALSVPLHFAALWPPSSVGGS